LPVAVGVAAQAVLEGMPDPRDLRLVEVDGQVLLTVGSRVIAGWAAGDAPMRNLAAVTLRGLGFSGLRVAEVLGLSEEYVSTLRGRARREGSAGVVPRRGRPPALGARELGRARRLRERGHSDVEIGRRLGVHPTTVGRALGARSRPTAPVLAQPPLTARTPPLDDDLPATGAQGSATPPTPDPAGKSEPRHHDDEQDDDEQHDDDAGRVAGAAAGSAGSAGSARIERAGVGSRYAGAMLLHAFWHRVDAAGVLGQACERGSGERRFDDLGLLTGTSMAFALGVSSVEGVKHLIGSQVGPLAGLAALPELRTLRPRLAALADRCDPLDLQARLAAAMLTADAPGLGVYFVDDHFVPYEGAKPVGKGWNTKRRHAQRGRDDTLVTDYHGRRCASPPVNPAGCR
jgi:hypothetical protein